MKPCRIEDIARAVGAAVAPAGTINGVCTDTRALVPGCLFIALKGERFDGHDYAVKAIEHGAAAVLCERSCGCGEKELLVEDTHRALLRLAAWYRAQFSLHVVAVTGSVGKTTTKEMTAAVVAQKYKTLKNPGNRNNEIGLPMTLFDLDEFFQAAVLEMGMSARGEIARLSETAAPTLGIITNIGLSHIEHLGSKENIAKAKFEIVAGMHAQAPLILNADDAILKAEEKFGRRCIYYGIHDESAEVLATDIRQSAGTTSFVLRTPGLEQPVTLPTIGLHNIYNAAAAFAAGMQLSVEPEAAARALATYETTGMRQRLREIRGMTFIEDCYNAGPDSMRAALNVLAATPARRRIAVLGDMLELGEHAPAAHRELGAYAAETGTQYLFACGPLSQQTVKAAREAGMGEAEWFADKSALADALIKMLAPDDAVLFKASRGIGLEDVLNQMYEELDTDE